MTATPRVFDATTAHFDGTRGDSVIASMDDLSIYGPVVYRISLKEAIDEGLLADYRIAGVVITDDDLRHALNRLSARTWSSEALRTAAAQLALLTAQHRYDLRRTLTFHPCIDAAEVFAETLPPTASLLPPALQGPLQIGTVSSRQSPTQRHHYLTGFADVPLDTGRSTAPPRRAVLTNCRCLSEGVDIPAIDSVLFAHPKTSTIDIVQSIGRALRQIPGSGKISTIIVPIYMAPGETLEEATRKSPFHLIYRVLIGLDVYDEHTFHRVDHLRWTGDPAAPQLAARPGRADEIAPHLGLSDVMAPNRVWEAAFETARAFHAAHGHLDVPSRHQAGRFCLGWWIGHQRSMRKNNLLLPERIHVLNTLDMLWEHPPHSIEYALTIARDYTRLNGHLAPRLTETHDGFPLGRWTAERRREARTGSLPYCYLRALNEIYPFWNASRDPRGTWRRTCAEALAAARRGQLAFPHPPPGPDAPPLTRWLDTQISGFFGLTEQQHLLLRALGLDHPLALLLTRPHSTAGWAFLRGLHTARAFRRTHQHLEVPYQYADFNSPCRRLGRWITERRRAPHLLTEEQRAALEALGIRWAVPQA
jgi:Helicase associated domain/Helicase conserved C-terminal domain